ncbi:MAG: DUF4157 domain-containing protein [Myxococcales bacterium]|nr:DUF4157 domain-containing protein [Myxococcales bacterium]
MSRALDRKPGASSLVQAMPEGGASAREPGKRTLTEQLGNGTSGAQDVHELAARGTSGSAGRLPHLDTIQRAFGPAHDLSGIRSHVGGPAAGASAAMGAQAYATGNQVAFAEAPSLHTAAHEAAHVIQQRSGVHLKGGVGQVGDPYERHADQVADAVVRGESAAGLLGPHGGGGSSSGPVQRRMGDDTRTTVTQEPGREAARVGQEPDRARGSGGNELDRRVGSHGGDVDGSGTWGSEADDRGITDRANHYMWTRVALAAETMGMPNAARHMRHYLGNTGATLTVSADRMLRDVALLRQAYDRQLADARQKAELRVADMGTHAVATNFQLTGDRKSDVYCSQSQSRDWFFAIGGFTYWYTAEVQVVPVADGPPQITIIFTLHVFDRYNWDQGKAVTLAGITVKDEQLGRLHRVGLAQEYDVTGTATPTTQSWSYTGTSTATPANTAPVAGERDGGRSDPSRERGRHVDNVRGSGGG